MLIIFAFYSLAIVACCTDAAPSSSPPQQQQQQQQLLRVPLIRSHNHPLQSTLQQLDKRDPFKDTLYNDQGSQYLIQVGIGTPPQNFTVTLDTGSADLWVPSSHCPHTECPFGGFQDSKSSTIHTNGSRFSIQYGIGSVNGTYAYDTVTVAGASVPGQQFGLATTTESILSTSSSNNQSSNGSVASNGILGLGYPRLTAAQNQDEQGYNPFVFNLIANKIIKDPVFSVYMNRADKVGWAGEIIFGGEDKSKYSGDLHYLPVAQLTSSLSPSSSGYYYWMVYAHAVAVRNTTGGADKTYKLNTSRSATAFILDTGTTLTYLPTEMATDIARSIAGVDGFRLDQRSGVFLVDCVTATSPATVQLQMSQTATASQSHVVLSVPASELVIPIDTDSVESASVCMLGIAPLGNNGGKVESNMLLVGDSMLRSTYLVFDIGQNRVGIASANGVPGGVNGVNTTSVPNGHVFSSDHSSPSSAASVENIVTPGIKLLVIASFMVLLA